MRSHLESILFLAGFVVPITLLIWGVVRYTLRHTDTKRPPIRKILKQPRAVDPLITLRYRALRQQTHHYSGGMPPAGLDWLGEIEWIWPVWDDFRHGSPSTSQQPPQQVGSLQAPAA